MTKEHWARLLNLIKLENYSLTAPLRQHLHAARTLHMTSWGIVFSNTIKKDQWARECERAMLWKHNARNKEVGFAYLVPLGLDASLVGAWKKKKKHEDLCVSCKVIRWANTTGKGSICPTITAGSTFPVTAVQFIDNGHTIARNNSKRREPWARYAREENKVHSGK